MAEDRLHLAAPVQNYRRPEIGLGRTSACHFEAGDDRWNYTMVAGWWEGGAEAPADDRHHSPRCFAFNTSVEAWQDGWFAGGDRQQSGNKTWRAMEG